MRFEHSGRSLFYFMITGKLFAIKIGTFFIFSDKDIFMRVLLYFLLLSAGIVGSVFSAHAAVVKNIHATWSSYTAPAGYTLAGFRLYKENAQVCQVSNPKATSLDCQVTFTDQTSQFSLAAVFTSGAESAHSATFSLTIPEVVTSGTQSSGVNIEIGEIELTHDWVRVPFQSTFTNPIVVVGALSFNGDQPCTTRIRNVNKTGFEVRITEWNYLDGTHKSETLPYLVVEKGRNTLPDGSIVEAGSFTGTTSMKRYNFTDIFVKLPVLVTSVVTYNHSDTLGGRIHNVNRSGFDYYFREQEVNINSHPDEMIHYVAWEPGEGKVGDIQYNIVGSISAVNHNWKEIRYNKISASFPFVLPHMQTTNGTDSSTLRVKNNATSGFQVKVEEELSYDAETNHADEILGYLQFQSNY